MKRILIVISVAIGTGLGLVFFLSFLSKVLFQNEASRLFFLCFISLLLSVRIIIASFIFSKRLTNKSNPIQYKTDIDWFWETGGKFFCIVVTVGLVFLSMGLFAFMGNLIAKL